MKVNKAIGRSKLRHSVSALSRYSVASFSAAAVSGAHFLVQIACIRTLPLAQVGVIAFILTIIQLGYGVSNAVVCAPYTIQQNRTNGSSPDILASVCDVNLLISVLQFCVCFLIGIYLIGGVGAFLFGAAGSLSLLRWFGRAESYSRLRPDTAAVSDIIYSILVVSGSVLQFFTHQGIAFVVFLIGAGNLFGLIPVRRSIIIAPFSLGIRRSLKSYANVWRRQGRWALLGVLTTEATINSHSYFVTALFGPKAFAPIAIGTLFLRPLNVCIVALTQLERPNIARSLSGNDNKSAVRSVSLFFMTLLAIWAATVAIAFTIVIFFPTIIHKKDLSLSALITAVTISSAIGLIQCLQTPISTYLQADDKFKLLSQAGILGCAISVPSIVVLLNSKPPVYSLIGVAIGQAAMTIAIGGLFVITSRNRSVNI